MTRRLLLAIGVLLASAALLLAFPRAALACPMCKEAVEGDSASANSYNWSVLALAVTPYVLIAVIATRTARAINPDGYAAMKDRAAAFMRRQGWMYLSGGVLAIALATFAMTPPTKTANFAAARTALARVTDTRRGVAIPPAELEGRVVVVTFFASWCEPCRDQMADLSQLRQSFAAEDVTILGVNAFEEYKVPHTHADGTIHYHDPSSSPRDLPKFLAGVGPGIFVLPVTPEINDAFAGVTRIPSTFVFDRDGRLVRQYVNDLTGDFMKPEAGVLRREIEGAVDCGRYSITLLRGVCLKWR
ncbi:MAG: TlpA family protein disulfide reductase [Chloroflexi bacterium]|nr:TlpA family protein disulfide reductase [Chloroflexota bacterium]